MTDLRFKEGEILFKEGDSIDRAFHVQEGQIELLKGFPDNPVQHGVIGVGEILQGVALIDERPSLYTARALRDGKATTLSHADFQTSLVADPQRCMPFLTALFERLRTLEARVEDRSQPELRVGGKAAGTRELRLFPLSRRTAQMLPEEGLLIGSFPCRVGRASEAKESQALNLNDIWLQDDQPFHVSRNHMEFALLDGRYVVRDRGSYLGTIVNERALGGKAKEIQAELEEGDNVVVLGSWKSPFRFRARLDVGIGPA